jgi:hypothetical protein
VQFSTARKGTPNPCRPVVQTSATGVGKRQPCRTRVQPSLGRPARTGLTSPYAPPAVIIRPGGSVLARPLADFPERPATVGCRVAFHVKHVPHRIRPSEAGPLRRHDSGRLIRLVGAHQPASHATADAVAAEPARPESAMPPVWIPMSGAPPGNHDDSSADSKFADRRLRARRPDVGPARRTCRSPVLNAQA